MTLKQNSSLGIVFILGLLAMLMPLSIDMYLPALPVIAAQYNVPDGSAQMTLSTYTPDGIRRSRARPVVLLPEPDSPTRPSVSPARS